MAVVNSVYEIPALSNYQITHKMRHLTKHFKGVYDMDLLPRERFKYPWAIIVNTEKDTSSKVGHWTAFVFDKLGRGHYFDSYGLAPPHSQWRHYLIAKSRGGVWKRSSLVVQRFDTNTCGYLCIDYIIRRLKHVKITDNAITRHLDGMKSYKKYHLN